MTDQNPISPPPLVPAATDQQGDVTGGIIPYKNPKALISYYLGIFSLIPVIGLLFGCSAVPLGILGLKARRKQPFIRGSIHAWVGIVLGSVSVTVHLILIGGILAAHWQAVHARDRVLAELNQMHIKADQMRVEANLMYVTALAHPYFMEKQQAEKVTVRELRAWLPNDVKLQPVAGENYDDLVIFRNAKTLSITLPSGATVVIQN